MADFHALLIGIELISRFQGASVATSLNIKDALQHENFATDGFHTQGDAATGIIFIETLNIQLHFQSLDAILNSFER
jgi:hypothetical protein